MRIFDGLEDQLDIARAHVTIGTFDGVHVGHQKIIKQLTDQAKLNKGESVLFTFDPHPRMVLNPGEPVPLLQTKEEKLDKLRRLGLQNVILYPFNLQFSKTPANQFIQNFLIEKLKMHAVVIGYDHQFGRNREGSLEDFKSLSVQYDFTVEEIPAQDIDDIHVSSTKIRNALLQGDIATANLYLGEPFQLNGSVVQGNSIGRTLGYPTANLNIENPNKIIPKLGVYLVRCTSKNETYFGMMNIGHRPTIAQNEITELSIEIHIFDFKLDIYGTHIQVELLSFIRDEQRFQNTDALKNQLQNDEISCRSLSGQFSLIQFSI